MPSAPDEFTNAEWHSKATEDAGFDHALYPRQYVVTCEWCDEVFFARRKADALTQFYAHLARVARGDR